MYESPKLNRIGNAQNVILGYVPTGNDIDANWCDSAMEYADEGEGPSNDVSLA